MIYCKYTSFKNKFLAGLTLIKALRQKDKFGLRNKRAYTKACILYHSTVFRYFNFKIEFHYSTFKSFFEQQGIS